MIAAREHFVRTAVARKYTVSIYIRTEFGRVLLKKDIRTRLDFPLHRSLEGRDEIHLERVHCTKEIRVHFMFKVSKYEQNYPTFHGFSSKLPDERTQHLIRLAEAESKLILVHELAILLRPLGPHIDRS